LTVEERLETDEDEDIYHFKTNFSFDGILTFFIQDFEIRFPTPKSCVLEEFYSFHIPLFSKLLKFIKKTNQIIFMNTQSANLLSTSLYCVSKANPAVQFVINLAFSHHEFMSQFLKNSKDEVFFVDFDQGEEDLECYFTQPSEDIETVESPDSYFLRVEILTNTSSLSHYFSNFHYDHLFSSPSVSKENSSSSKYFSFPGEDMCSLVNGINEIIQSQNTANHFDNFNLFLDSDFHQKDKRDHSASEPHMMLVASIKYQELVYGRYLEFEMNQSISSTSNFSQFTFSSDLVMRTCKFESIPTSHQSMKFPILDCLGKGEGKQEEIEGGGVEEKKEEEISFDLPLNFLFLPYDDQTTKDKIGELLFGFISH